MTAKDPARVRAGRLGAAESWANTVDRAARTRAARAKVDKNRETRIREQHPDATDAQVARMVEARRKADQMRLSAAGVAARSRKASAA